jgi:glycerol transport system ATP-binding protein
MTLKLSNIRKLNDGYEVLRDLNLTVENNGLLVIVAPPGNGKTTLLRVIAGLDVPDSGQVWMDGEDVTGTHVRDRQIAMLYQQFINYPSLTVFENIASPLRVSSKRYSADDIKTRVQDIASRLGIVSLLHHMPEQLGSEEQQLVALARTLVKEARIVLLDEPLNNLDDDLRDTLRLQIKHLAAERETTLFIYATSDPSDAQIMASQVAILQDGQIVQSGSVQDVYQHP